MHVERHPWMYVVVTEPADTAAFAKAWPGSRLDPENSYGFSFSLPQGAFVGACLATDDGVIEPVGHDPAAFLALREAAGRHGAAELGLHELLAARYPGPAVDPTFGVRLAYRPMLSTSHAHGWVSVHEAAVPDPARLGGYAGMPAALERLGFTPATNRLAVSRRTDEGYGRPDLVTYAIAGRLSLRRGGVRLSLAPVTPAGERDLAEAMVSGPVHGDPEERRRLADAAHDLSEVCRLTPFTLARAVPDLDDALPMGRGQAKAAASA